MKTRYRQVMLLAVLVIVAAFVGCRSMPYMVGLKRVPLEQAAPLVSQAGINDAHSDRLNVGREIYVGKCTNCHKAIPVYEYSIEEWSNDIIPRMSKKAKLTPEETENLVAYIRTARSSPVVSATNASLGTP